MSARATRPSRRSQPVAPDAAREGAAVVQQVLAERRQLMVTNERLRLELENRALRDELAAVRAELERFEAAVLRVLEEIEKASP